MENSGQIKGLISYMTKLTHTVDAFRIKFVNIEVVKVIRGQTPYPQIEYDLDITPNRADLLSVMGVAYDTSAILNTKLHLKEYKVKDYVVYPKHGVGQITEFKKINIGGIDVETYVLKFEKDKANGMVPVNKQSHLRPLATINQVNKCISILKSKPKIKRSMWSRRAQEYEAKISSGKIYELAEVVRDLNKGDDLMVDQSYSERQLFEKAYERILSEFQIVQNVSLEDTQKKLDKALKRNLGGQTQPTIAAPKSSATELPVEEPISDADEPIEE